MATSTRTLLGWSSVVISTVLMVLASSLILYPSPTLVNILTALRLSSVTTALPFLLIFVARPLVFLTGLGDLGAWIQANRRYLWLMMTVSHLIHLYQIRLYYQLGQSCPPLVWMITAPLWIVMVLFAGIEIFQPQRLAGLYQGRNTDVMTLLHKIGGGYIWLVFTLAFGLAAVDNHLLFYNVPALVLFLAGGVLHGFTWRRQGVA
jgi:hypothetical protein